jgi:hypothetical protein
MELPVELAALLGRGGGKVKQAYHGDGHSRAGGGRVTGQSAQFARLTETVVCGRASGSRWVNPRTFGAGERDDGSQQQA